MKILKSMVIFFMLALPGLAQHPQSWRSFYDSTQLYWAKDWDRTVSLLERAEKSALTDLGLYHENYLTILNDLGTAYWKARKFPLAEKALSKSLNLKSEVYSANDKEVILSMSNLAGFYAEQGSLEKSRKLYKRILAADPAHIPHDTYIAAAQSLVLLYDTNQQLDSARNLLKKMEQWDFVPANSYLAFQHQFYTARIHRKLQEYTSAQKELETLGAGLAEHDEPELRELNIQCIQEQGILYLQTGSYSKAEKYLLRAYEMATADHREFLLTELSNNLAQVYDKLNIYDKALLYYQESLARCQQSYAENALPCVILHNNIAGIHLKQDNIPKAIKGYESAIGEFEKLLAPSDPLYITALNNLATAHRRNNQLNVARQYLEKAEKLVKASGLNGSDIAATILNNIAIINTAQGDHAQAARNYKSAYDIKRSIYGANSVLLMDLINNLAVTYWALNRPADAIPLFKKSMELATRQVTYIFPNLNEREQVQFYERLKEDFERFNTIAIQWGAADGELISRMFQNRTIIKSLQFFTHQRRKNHIGLKNDPELNELVVRLKECRDRLGHLYQLPLNKLAGGESVQLLEREIDSLEKTISLRSAEAVHYDQLMVEVHWSSLIPRLQANEAIVEMVRFRKYDLQSSKKKGYFGFADSVYYAALIVTRETKDKPDIVLLKDGNNLETRFYNYYKNTLRYKVKDDYSYHFFWQTIEKRLAGKSRIYFSSDGVYHRININTLRDPKTGQYLLDKFDIVYLLNPMQVLQNKTPVDKMKRNAVLMGDPVFDLDVERPRERGIDIDNFVGLPGTHEEIKAIDKLLKSHSWKTTLFMKGAATESNLKSIRSPAILHLASHGFFSSDVVSLNAEAKKEFLFHSGLVLSGANRSLSTGSTSFHNDGIVTAFEVMNLDLTNTQLVVLSACETGLGKIENGEGVFGLQRSFMQAGARNVLISLWKVDDQATRDLMIKFYQYLALGNSFHESLMRAQSDQSKLLTDAALWGGFVLVGNN